MVALDTAFLIRFLKNRKDAVDSRVALDGLNGLLGAVEVLELNGPGVDPAARLFARLNQMGQIDDKDILIAAIALTHGEESIVTQNIKGFSK